MVQKHKTTTGMSIGEMAVLQHAPKTLTKNPLSNSNFQVKPTYAVETYTVERYFVTLRSTCAFFPFKKSGDVARLGISGKSKVQTFANHGYRQDGPLRAPGSSPTGVIILTPTQTMHHSSGKSFFKLLYIDLYQL